MKHEACLAFLLTCLVNKCEGDRIKFRLPFKIFSTLSNMFRLEFALLMIATIYGMVLVKIVSIRDALISMQTTVAWRDKV